MLSLLQIVFWTALGLVFYTYIGYPILLTVLVELKSRWTERPASESTGFDLPTCTLVIAAYNERECILQKAQNSLALQYPEGKLKIAFITDGSDDGTHEVLEELKTVTVWHQSARKGKIAAINRAMALVKSDIVVFCDANTVLNQTALLELAKHYQQPEVGGVSGEKIVLSADKDSASGSGEGLYWKYESYLKRKDAELHTLVGSAGELFSIRTSLFQPVEEDCILDDFMISMGLVERGYRVAYEPNAQASETASINIAEEFKRKVRIAAGGFQSMHKLSGLLNPLKYETVAFEYISHRVFRWTVAPFALPVLVFLNIALFLAHSSMVYELTLVLQVAFYAAAFLGWILESQHIKLKILFVPFYFLMMHCAVLLGYVRYLRGHQSTLWAKSQRRTAPVLN